MAQYYLTMTLEIILPLIYTLIMPSGALEMLTLGLFNWLDYDRKGSFLSQLGLLTVVLDENVLFKCK